MRFTRQKDFQGCLVKSWNMVLGTRDKDVLIFVHSISERCVNKERLRAHVRTSVKHQKLFLFPVDAQTSAAFSTKDDENRLLGFRAVFV